MPLKHLFFALTLAPIAVLAAAPTASAQAVSSYAVVDTGQTACYGADGTGFSAGPQPCPAPGRRGHGQDAQYSINAPSYTDNGDGTVSDNVTGLMWQKGFTRNVSFDGAAAEAARATTGGHTDWRVPTIKELYSLIDFRGSTGSGRPSSNTAPPDAVPFIDRRAFTFEYPSSGRFIDAQYVTRTAYRGRAMGQPAFFGVNFADGRIKGYPQNGGPRGRAWYGRFVRGNPAYGRNTFRDAGNGVINDTATGLAWVKTDSGDGSVSGKLGDTHYRDGRLDWPEALAFCEGLTFAGASDWRLPSAKELHSLVDYTRSPSATRSAAVDPLFHSTAITDEAGKPNYPGYWTSTTLLVGRQKGTDAIVVYFGEALGAPAFAPGGPGGPGQGQRQGMGPPPGGERGPGPEPGQGQGRPPPPGGGGRVHGIVLSGSIIDVHGAGAQRSDPKTGNAANYPSWGHGPQGDVRRVYNHVRCVRSLFSER